MVTIGLMFGAFAMPALLLIVVILRRGNSATENADGLLIEQARRLQAHQDRVSFDASTALSASPIMSDLRHRRR
ncbi:hypothetical protein STXM2123_801 [Streptomyces sp. F-3]|uniref:Uncharacterized protein n=2 Tax=Streptomyces TaxID=1883 RepID=A0ABN1SW19_9ACTN|nr:hypothetical protein STXM2123_801 [Streptomyces sp. F-3]